MSIVRVIVLIGTIASTAFGETTSDASGERRYVTPLQEEIISQVPDGWRVSFSSDEMVLTLPGVRFLNSINPPLVSEEELWRSHGWTGDYVIRIWTSPAIEPNEYKILVEARRALRESRVTEENPDREPWRNQLDYFVERSLPLPLCRVGSLSVWVSANDRLGHHWIRPASASEFKIKILGILKAKGQIYEEAQQGGADQPATAPESKPEGKEKPKPDSEGRSQ